MGEHIGFGDHNTERDAQFDDLQDKVQAPFEVCGITGNQGQIGYRIEEGRDTDPFLGGRCVDTVEPGQVFDDEILAMVGEEAAGPVNRDPRIVADMFAGTGQSIEEGCLAGIWSAEQGYPPVSLRIHYSYNFDNFGQNGTLRVKVNNMENKRMYNPLLLLLCLVRLVLVVVLTAIILPVVILARFAGHTYPHACARIWARLVLLVLGVRVHKTGTDRDWSPRSVIISNHLGYLDIPVLLVSLTIPFRFIADSDVFRVPLLGLAMRFCGYLPIWRSGHNRINKTMQAAMTFVRNGIPVVIFPEGGINRTADGEGYCRVLSGFASIARETGSRVHQVTLCGTGDAQRNLCRFTKKTASMLLESHIEIPPEDKKMPREAQSVLAKAIDARSREAFGRIRGFCD